MDVAELIVTIIFAIRLNRKYVCQTLLLEK